MSIKRNTLSAAALCVAAVFSGAQTPPPPADLGQFKDLEQMARQFTGDSNTVAGDSSSNVMLFVSLSMPTAVLKELASQASDAGIPMVLRGFAKAPGQVEAVNPTLTTERITEALTSGMVGSTKSPSWAVDPEAFKTFGINRVPALVVAHQRLPGASCQKDAMLGEKGEKLGQSCASDWDAAVIYGDTSLHESLRRATQSKSPEVVQLAQASLARLRGQEPVRQTTNAPVSTPVRATAPQQTAPQSSQRSSGEIRIR